jgi:hypothetical protein
VFYLAHADAGVPYDFYIPAPVCLYGFVIPIVGEEQTDAPARRVPGVAFYGVQYYHVPRVRRVPLRRGHTVAACLSPPSRLS